MNKTSKKNATSKYLGVHYSRGKYKSQIKVNKQTICIGTFCSEEDAARAYDSAALLYFGEYSNLNFK